MRAESNRKLPAECSLRPYGEYQRMYNERKEPNSAPSTVPKTALHLISVIFKIKSETLML